MKKIAFIGKGELTNQLRQLAQLNDNSDSIYFDDNLNHHEKNYFPFNIYLNNDFEEFEFCVGIGYKHLQKKKEIFENLINNQRKLFTIAHSSAHISSSSTIANGVAIYPMCNIDKEVIVSEGVILNNSVVVSHNSKIGRCSYLSPGVVLSGNVQVGECTFIGSGTIVSNTITIGNNVVIGPGSVITKNISDGQHVIGNPARVLSTKLNLK